MDEDSSDEEEDDSDSDSDSDDASIFSAFSFGANNDAVNFESDGNGEAGEYEMKLSLSSNTLMNLWLIVGLCAVINILAFCMYRDIALKTNY